jgi:hypothetical protein
MGFQAAKLLHRQLNRQAFEKLSDHKAKTKSAPRVLVPPIGIIQRQSTDFKALQDPYVIQAMHYMLCLRNTLDKRQSNINVTLCRLCKANLDTYNYGLILAINVNNW